MKKNVYINYPGDIGISVELEGSNIEEILENAFAAFNSGSGREHPEFSKNRRLRSLSVNDTICIDKEWYQCASIGWEKVTAKYVDELEKEVVSHPMFEEHGPWYALSEIMYSKKHLQNA